MVAQSPCFLCSSKWKAKRDSRDHQVVEEARTISSIFQMILTLLARELKEIVPGRIKNND